ncbi:MAG: hypothetical protein K8T90_19605, partial [Planctomycetes bacterium]|nr:hypothetical protein [Planctomycetota bacterium]
TGFDDPEIPSTVPAGVRAVAARPGVLVATGPDASVAAYVAAIEASRVARLAPSTFRVGASSIPFVSARGCVLVQGRITPFAGATEVDIAQESCSAAARTEWVFAGRTIRVVPETGGVVAEIHESDAAKITQGMAAMQRSDDDGTREVKDARDTVELHATSRRVSLPIGGPAVDAAAGAPTLEATPW